MNHQVGRCSTCGEEIYAGDEVWQGPDGELYCDEWCVARSMASAVIADGDGHMPYASGPDYTYDEALRLARAYERLSREARELIWLWRGVAKEMRDERQTGMAVAYRRCAELLEQALEDASPTAPRKLTVGDNSGAARHLTTAIVPQEACS